MGEDVFFSFFNFSRDTKKAYFVKTSFSRTKALLAYSLIFQDKDGDWGEIPPLYSVRTWFLTAQVLHEYGASPGGSGGKESACNAGVLGSVPGLGRAPGGRHGNPLQYSCLENPMDRGAWQATVHGFAKSQTCLSD